MKLYELTYLIPPELSEKEIKNLQEKIISLVQERGILIETNLPKRKFLSYPIKKKSSAFFATLNFQLKPENLLSFEKKLEAEPNILRYLILTKKALVPIKPRKTTLVKPKVKKVELKEIEKKLEELLKE